MKASESTLQQLLEGNKQFQIPQFQRKYCWKEDQWNVLWEDLISIYDGECKGGYFIGAIVTQSLPGTANGISPFFVIDGQQRLTTITLLLAAIRDLLNLDNTDRADEINRHLVNASQKDNDYYKIFYPYREVDCDIYKSIISKNKILLGDEKYFHITHSLIYKAFYFFKDILKDAMDRRSIDLCKLTNIVLSELLFINITSGDNDNPYLIFEGLNNKGLLLTQGDLIRSYVLMKSLTLLQKNEIHEEWKSLEKNLTRVETYNPTIHEELLTQYFWAYLRKDGIIMTENQTYKYMIRRFEQSPDKYQLLKELNHFSNYYAKLNLKEKEPEERIFKYFLRFRELDFRTCNVFLLNIYQLYDSSRISCDDFEEILWILESYFVRRFFTGISTSVLGKVFDNLYKDVLQNTNANSIVTALKITIKRYEYSKSFPQDNDFRKAIINKKIYSGNDRKRVKFILERLENSIKRNTKEKSFVLSRNLTIEHIMPQKLSPAWQQNDVIHKQWLHTLGNLTLTADNPSLSNKAFTEKKTIYQESKLNLNTYFDNIDIWNADTIEKRAHELADMAVKIWPMP